MTWDNIYAIFPLDTMVNHRLYPLRPLDDQFGTCLAELALQGWTSRDVVWLDLIDLKVQHIGTRRVGDRYTLTMPLHPILEGTGQTPDYVIEHAEFVVLDQRSLHWQNTPHWQRMPPFQQPPQQRTARFGGGGLSVKVQELASPALRYQYTVGHGANPNWHDFVKERLKRWSVVELLKIPSSRRPQSLETFESSLHTSLSRDQLPATWDYADDQMPVMYKQWEERTKRAV